MTIRKLLIALSLTVAAALLLCGWRMRSLQRRQSDAQAAIYCGMYSGFEVVGRPGFTVRQGIAGVFEYVTAVSFRSQGAIDDVQLSLLRDLPYLEWIDLSRIRIVESQLQFLHALPHVKTIDLCGTGLSEQSIRRLQRQLPRTEILTWSPAKERDIAMIRQRGGDVRIDERSPGRPIVGVSLDKSNLTDSWLAHLKRFTKLQSLALSRTNVSDAGLVHLKALSKLKSLELWKTDITDAGLVHVKSLTNLRNLFLEGTRVSDIGLGHLKALSNLELLGLDKTEVTDTGLESLKGMAKLRLLYLAKTSVTDHGLVHLTVAVYSTRADADREPNGP